MLSKTALSIIKSLVSKGTFEDPYDGANIIISLINYPDVLHAYLEAIEASNKVKLSNLEATPISLKDPGPTLLRTEVTVSPASQPSLAKQAILDLEV